MSRDEEHVLRGMLDAPAKERDGEKGRTPGGKTHVKDIWKVWGDSNDR